MLSLTQWLASSEEFFRSLGWLGILAFAGGIVLIQLFCGPTSPALITAGLIFGFGRGFLIAMLGTGLGAAVNFYVSRRLMRGAVARRLAQDAKFQLIDRAIGREGWKIVALLRFCPIPFGLANYCYGLTAIRFWPYLLSTVVAILLPNAFWVWLGVSAHAGLAVATGAEKARHPGEYALLAIGLVAGFFALAYIARIARAALAEAAPPIASADLPVS
jgi:uncharacterized membrane protein YdjX (TVP38/TMEM64 family)